MDSPAAEPPAPAQPRPRRWLRWICGLFLTLILAVALVWNFRLKIVRSVLARSLPNFPAQIESLDWQQGGMELRGFKLTDPSNSSPWLEIARAHLSVNPLKLASGELGEITVETPRVHLTPAILEKLQQPHPATSKAPPAFHLSGLHVKDAALDVTLPSGETAALVLNWQGGAASFSESKGLDAERQTITLRQVNVRPEAATPGAAAAEISLECSADAAKRLFTVHQLHTTELSAKAGAALWKALGLNKPTSTTAVASTSSARPPFDHILLEDVAVGPMDVAFQELPWLPKLPPGRGHVTFLARQVSSSLTAAPAAGNFEFSLTDFALGTAENPLLTLPQMTAQAAIQSDGAWMVKEFKLAPTQIKITTAQLAEFGLSGWLPSLEVSGTLGAEAHDLKIQDSTVASDASQEIELNHVQVRRPGADHNLITWDEFSAAGQWEEITAEKRFRRLQWSRPIISLAGDDIVALTPPSNTKSEPADTALPAWHGWRCDEPRCEDGAIQARSLAGGTPDFEGKFSIETAASIWRLLLEEIVVHTPGHPKAPPLYRGQSVLLDIDPAHLWRDRRIERVKFQSSRIQVGVTDADSQAPESSLEQASVPTGINSPLELDLGPQPLDWHIGSVELANTKIYLHNLIPDAPEILIPLAQKTLRNIPLTLEGLKQSDDQQRIELPFVYVPGTRAGTSVADFDTNFLHFSLAGLMHKEIELVELVNPKIYVGDSLFHYVDKLRATSPPADDTPALSAIRGLAASLVSALGELPASEVPLVETNPGWKISRIKAVNGKLITTVKDSPLIRVPPLPFGADSSVKEGKINAQLAVPPGLYKPLLGTELVVAISQGTIVFNLPLRHRDNNLVQIFKADWLRYKQFRIADVTLQVTYDKNGVYAHFWAKAYQGDLEGAFNLYLDDNLSWDMWLAGTNLETKDITQTLTPAYFNMTGPVTGKIIAQGDKTSLYQATGEFSNGTAGTIHVTALEDAIKAIPGDWSEAERKIVTKLMETVRDFNYDKCTGKLRFYGLEGEVHLNLTGPDGARNFDVFSHDRRLSEK